MNKGIIGLIGLCLLASGVGLIGIVINESVQWGYRVIDIGLGLGQLMGLMMLISNGTIMGTVYWRIIWAFLAITLFGALLKILHYFCSDQFLLVGLLGVAITYLIRFISKKKKGHLDFLKLLWVLSSYLGGALLVLHIIPRYFTCLIQGTFWIVFLDFVWLEFKGRGSN